MFRRFTYTMLLLVCSAGCNKTAAQSAKDAPAVEPIAHVTIVGCVQPSDSTATNAAGVNDTKYMLTNARSSSGDAKAASAYRLNASDATLSAEVGHQVEIVAVVDDPQPAPAPAGTSGSSSAKAPAPKLKVETIKMIAVPCPD
jgi:hypothetical protein